MSLKTDINLEEIKRRVPLPKVLSYFGIEVKGTNIKCLWHSDDSPSLQIFSDHAFCHAAGCHRSYDIFSFVMKLEKLSFEKAVRWILEKEKILPESVMLDKPKEYQGPVPQKWIDHWVEQLDEERAQYLYDRGITSDTISELRIGYRPDKVAYTIPFWSGVPGWSEIDTFQYRAAPNSNSKMKYYGEKGYVRPAVLNADLINPRMVILVFGTLDAVLGRQDGLPMLSTNGAEVFSNPNRMEFQKLRQSLLGVEQVYVLPDATLTEFESAYKLVNQLCWEVNAKMCYFPRKWGVKDYNQARMSTYTVQNFVEEVLQMPWHDGFFFAVSKEHAQDIINIISCICEAQPEKAMEIMQIVAHHENVWYGAMRHAMMMACVKGPYYYGGVFTSEEWGIMIRDIESCEGYPELIQFIGHWSKLAGNRLGGF